MTKRMVKIKMALLQCNWQKCTGNHGSNTTQLA